MIDLLRDGDRVTGVRVRQPDGTEAEHRAPITLDCSGKESFAASRNRWRVPDPELNKVAVWTYYKGAKRDKGIDEGTTTVAFLPEKGWFLVHPAARRPGQRRRRGRGQIPHARRRQVAQGYFSPRSHTEQMDRGIPRTGQVHRRLLRHQRVFISLEVLRLRRLATARRCLLFSRSRFLVRPHAGAQERGDGGRRGTRGNPGR